MWFGIPSRCWHGATLNRALPNLSKSQFQHSRSVVSGSLRRHESQHARAPCPSPTSGVHSDSGPSSQWCHPAISSSDPGIKPMFPAAAGRFLSTVPPGKSSVESFNVEQKKENWAKILDYGYRLDRGLAGKESTCDAGDPGLILCQGAPLEKGMGPHFRYLWTSLVAQILKNLPAMRRPRLERSPGGRRGNPLQYSCLENPHGQRNLAGYSPWGSKELDTTERLSTVQHIHWRISVTTHIELYDQDTTDLVLIGNNLLRLLMV